MPNKEAVASDAEQCQVSNDTQKGKKRKRPKAVSKMEKSLGVIMDKFVASQRETEERYIDLEEKRLKLTKELEEQRQELEERRRERDRQHELQMWSMMMNMMGSSGMGGPPRFPMPYQFYPTMPGNPPGSQESLGNSSSCNSNSYPSSPS